MHSCMECLIPYLKFVGAISARLGIPPVMLACRLVMVLLHCTRGSDQTLEIGIKPNICCAVCAAHEQFPWWLWCARNSSSVFLSDGCMFTSSQFGARARGYSSPQSVGTARHGTAQDGTGPPDTRHNPWGAMGLGQRKSKGNKGGHKTKNKEYKKGHATKNRYCN